MYIDCLAEHWYCIYDWCRVLYYRTIDMSDDLLGKLGYSVIYTAYDNLF